MTNASATSGLVACAVVLAALAVSVASSGTPAPADVQVDHYQALEIQRTATQKEVRAAYKRLSVLFHPDKHTGKDSERDALVRFEAISAAYEVLGDPDKRSVYDNFGDQKFTNKWEAQHSGANLAAGFYSDHAYVHTLEDWMFRSFRFQGDRAAGPLANHPKWMIEFYAPWCVHCQEMVGAWKKAASLLDGEIAFGAVNCEQHQTTCRNWNIRSYPTLMYVSQDEAEQQEYHGGHSVDDIVSFARAMVSDHVARLTPASFHDLIAQSTVPWFVMFTAGRWCGPCTSAKPQWRLFANRVHAHAKVGVVDCDAHDSFCAQLGVPSYPHFRGFGAHGAFGGEAGEELFRLREMGVGPALELIGRVLELAGSGRATDDNYLGHDEL